jgi:DNA-binding NarL/FixJ family response regulator
MATLPTVVVSGETVRAQYLERTLRDLDFPKPLHTDDRADVAVILPADTTDIPAAVGRSLLELARRAIVMAEMADAASLVATVAAGADGLVPPSIAPTALARTICGIHDGESGFSRIDTVVLIAALRAGHLEALLPNGLTQRERQIHQALQTGRPTREIAGDLAISEATIRWHAARIAKKLQPATGADAEPASIPPSATPIPPSAAAPTRSGSAGVPSMDERRSARAASDTRSTPGLIPEVSSAARLAALGRAELRVVELVADGLSNREIAEQLFLSRHTIESHLKRVYAKLHIRSRVELTRLLLSATDPKLAS